MPALVDLPSLSENEWRAVRRRLKSIRHQCQSALHLSLNQSRSTRIAVPKDLARLLIARGIPQPSGIANREPLNFDSQNGRRLLRFSPALPTSRFLSLSNNLSCSFKQLSPRPAKTADPLNTTLQTIAQPKKTGCLFMCNVATARAVKTGLKCLRAKNSYGILSMPLGGRSAISFT